MRRRNWVHVALRHAHCAAVRLGHASRAETAQGRADVDTCPSNQNASESRCKLFGPTIACGLLHDLGHDRSDEVLGHRRPEHLLDSSLEWAGRIVLDADEHMPTPALHNESSPSLAFV